jgi:CRP-like cAMP-binding protein
MTSNKEDNELLNKMFDCFSKYITFSDEEKQIITKLATVIRLKKGDFLLKEGEISNKGFFVLEGCLRVFYFIDGEEKTTSFYTEMESITPHCAVNKLPSAYYISCVEDSIIASATLDVEPEITELHPRFDTLCRMLAENFLAESQASFDKFKTSSPEQLYLNLQKTRPDLLQRVPQYQLASYIGISPVSLSRLRARIIKK